MADNGVPAEVVTFVRTVLHTAMLNDPRDPLVIGECFILRCQQQYDFIDVVVDRRGTVWTSMVDGCRGRVCFSPGQGILGASRYLVVDRRVPGDNDAVAVDMDEFAAWTSGYARACESNDAEAAAALFTEEAVYYTTPFDQPWVGREEITANWIETADVLKGFECRCDPVAVTGNTGVARWWAIYPSTGMEFSSVFVVTFGAPGRVSEFREWYMSRELEE